MIPERDDPIIDPLLEELLGHQQPPDLTARILAAWSERSSASASSVVKPALSGKRRRRTLEWLQFSVSLATAAAVLAVAYVGFTWSEKGKQTAAQVTQPESPQRDPATPQAIRHPHSIVQPKVANSKPITPVDKVERVQPPVVSPKHSLDANSSAMQPETALASQSAPRENNPPIANATKDPSPIHAPPQNDAAVITFVNAQLHQTWQEHGVQPAPMADNEAWCRRVFVRLIGRIPTVEELQQFAMDRSSDKRAKLVERLLYDEHYVLDYARHWSSVWTNILLGHGVGIEEDEPASREGMEKYLRDAFARNKPFDTLVKEIITASGPGSPHADHFNGAANYLLAASDDRGITATDRTCRIFLGVRLQCAQCHDHPTEPWKQTDFWSMNAFFRQLKVRQTDRNDPAQLLDFDYLGDDGRDPQGLVFYELPNGLLKAAEPRFLDGQSPLANSGLVSEVNRREELARMIVQSKLFGEALVNRVWSQFHGYGFTKPLDDMGPNNPPSHPELLARLSQEFVSHRYDFKQLLTWIALSDSFQRSSTPPSANLVDAPSHGAKPLFSYYYARPLAGEEVIRSLQIAAKLRRETGSNGNIAQARVDWLAQYQRSLPKDAANETTSLPSVENSIIPSGLMKHATTLGQEGLLSSVMQAKLSFNEKVEHLFLAALSRKPTKAERQTIAKLAGMNGMQESAALEDIWWALLNSSEFLLDH
jgi:hypothetical protein